MILSDSITIPDSLLIWIGSIIASCLAAFLTFFVHLGIVMNGKLDGIVLNEAVTKEKIAMLERHDTNNKSEVALMLKYLLKDKEANL